MSHEETSVLDTALSSDDENERYRAVATAASSAQEGAQEILERALGDSSWRVRKAAVAALAERADDEEAWRVISAGLADAEDAGRRTAVLELMERLGERLLPRILELSTHPEATLRKCALDVLAARPDPASLEALLARVEDTDPNVRGVAVEALGHIDDKRAVDALTGVLVSQDRRDALEMLAALRGLIALDATVDRKLLEPLLENPLLRSQALRLIARCPGEEILPLLIAAFDKSSLGAARAAVKGLYECCKDAPPLREAAVARLQQSRERSNGALLAVYATDERAAVDAALAVAGWLADPELAAGLYEARRGRWLGPGLFYSLGACGEAGAKAVADRLERMEPDDQLAAVEALTSLGDAAIAGQVAALLERGAGRVAEAAARCVGEIGDAAQAGVLAGHLADMEGAVADACAAGLRALAEREPREVRAALEPLLTRTVSDPAHTRAVALLALVASDADQSLLTTLRRAPDAAVRASALRGLGRLDLPGAVRAVALQEALDDEEPSVRRAAIEALATPEVAELESLLARALADPDPRLRAAGLTALARHLPASAPFRLEEALVRGGEEARAAVLACRHLEREPRAALLRRALGADDAAVVGEVAELLPAVEADEAVDLLRPLLASPHLAVRLNAVTACRAAAARWPERRAELVAVVREALRDETEDLVRETAEALIVEIEAA